MTSEQITQIILALITLMGTVVGAFLVPYIKSKTTLQQRENVYAIIVFGVKAAQQIYGQDTGIEKYDYVVKYIQNKGINIDEKDLKVMIESAVKELKLAQNEMLN